MRLDTGFVTDINLTETERLGTAEQVKEIEPPFLIINMTGAAADRWGSSCVPNSILLAKPFAPAQLITAISQLLNTGSPPTAPA